MSGRAASGMVKAGVQFGKQAMGAAGKGALKGVEEAAKEAAKQEARNRLGRFISSSPASRSIASAGEASPFSHAVFRPSATTTLVLSQEYPTVCECEPNPRAEYSPSGHRLFECHSCAGKGMSAREYRTYLESLSHIQGLAPRPRPSYTRGRSRRSPSPNLPALPPSESGAPNSPNNKRRASRRRSSSKVRAHSAPAKRRSSSRKKRE
jgi:hypothetical protein